MPNWYPYNDMLFDEYLQVGDCAVKTRSWSWDYRGPVLFYTSSRTAHRAVEAYGYQRTSSSHKVIVGTATLVDVRELTTKEARKMVRNFNNLSEAQLKRILFREDYTNPYEIFLIYDLGLIAPYHVGFFFKDKMRFSVPVPFNWPVGPVKPIFIETTKYPKLIGQLRPLRRSLDSK